MLTAELANNERNVNRNIHKYNAYRYEKMHVSVLGINDVRGWRYRGRRGGREDRYGSARRDKEGGERRGMR